MSGWKVSSGYKSSNRLLPLALGPPHFPRSSSSILLFALMPHLAMTVCFHLDSAVGARILVNTCEIEGSSNEGHLPPSATRHSVAMDSS